MAQPYLVKDLGEHWRTVYPEVTNQFDELFYDALEMIGTAPAKAEKQFKKIITACGNGHLDAILQLGLFFNDRNKPIEGNALITKAYNLAKEAFPADFIPGYDQILWSHTDNRPLLQSLWSYAMELQKVKDYERATKEFEFCLRVNPNDNKGVRFLLLECYLQLAQYEKALELEKDYEGDYSVEFYYGKVLAWWHTGSTANAAEQLAAAKSKFPHIAAELLKKVHVFPFEEFEHTTIFDGSYPLGSRQEAYQYWINTRGFWLAQPELMLFLEKHLLP